MQVPHQPLLTDYSKFPSWSRSLAAMRSRNSCTICSMCMDCPLAHPFVWMASKSMAVSHWATTSTCSKPNGPMLWSTPRALRSFNAKVEDKAKWSRGLFLSYSGFLRRGPLRLRARQECHLYGWSRPPRHSFSSARLRDCARHEGPARRGNRSTLSPSGRPYLSLYSMTAILPLPVSRTVNLSCSSAERPIPLFCEPPDNQEMPPAPSSIATSYGQSIVP